MEEHTEHMGGVVSIKLPPFRVGILFWDNKVIERKFLMYHVACNTMKSLGDIGKRYPGTIKNLWMV